MLPWADIITAILAFVTVLQFLLEQPFIPPEVLPWIGFAIAVLNAAVVLLRALFPESQRIKSLRL